MVKWQWALEALYAWGHEAIVYRSEFHILFRDQGIQSLEKSAINNPHLFAVKIAHRLTRFR